MFRPGLVTIAVLVAGCGDRADAPTPAPVPAGAVADAAIDGAGALEPVGDEGAHALPRPASKKVGRPIEIVLRSSPPGALVSVDGTLYGATPQVWSGETGADHEFTFTMGGFSMARYRFTPITTGVLHAKLEPVAEEIDAGVAPPEVVPPRPVTPPPIAIDAPMVIVPDAATVDGSAASGFGPSN